MHCSALAKQQPSIAYSFVVDTLRELGVSRPAVQRCSLSEVCGDDLISAESSGSGK